MLNKKKDSNKDHVLPDEAIIERKDHTLSKTNISVNALKVLNRLNAHHFEAHLVGGSVRDLLLGACPKDFDIATNAHPNEVRKLFKNARLIGRRFRLAHILFYREIIEVATFRKQGSQSDTNKTNDEGMIVRDNEYGTITDDVWRRDFTINALYYNIADFSIIDFTNGFNDLKNKIVRMIGDPDKRYQEDPVRMLRAVRFCAKLDFTLEENTQKSLHQLKDLIKNVAPSRLFDEVCKLYHQGHGVRSQALLEEHQLFEILFPFTSEEMEKDESVRELITHTLKSTDNRIRENKPVTPAFLFAILLWRPLLNEMEYYQQKGIPPLNALEKAMNAILSKQNKYISIPKRFTQSMREMWLLQYRLPKRYGNRAFRSLEHPRFRAAYDFLLLRTLVGEEDTSLADWWTTFQEVNEDEQHKMILKLSKPNHNSTR